MKSANPKKCETIRLAENIKYEITKTDIKSKTRENNLFECCTSNT